jgi:hypothetical protein
MAEIEGASAEQRALFEELLAGMPGTRLEAFRLEPWDPIDWDELASLGIARGDPRHAQPTGVALIATRPVHVDTRGEWEVELLGLAFRDRAANRGLPPVLCAGHRDGRAALQWEHSKSPLPDEDLPRVEERVRQAVDAADARLASLEVFRVGGHALAATIEVDEPHSFLRYRLRPLFQALAPVFEPLAGDYVEVRDREPERVYVRARYGYGCIRGARADLACCDPSYRQMTEGPRRPLCPILGAA